MKSAAPIIHNNLATPILLNGEVIGLLNIANKDGGYTDADRDRLDALAARVAPVLYAWIQKDLREKDRTAAEEALKSAKLQAETEKRHLQAVLKSLPVGVIITDEHGGVLLANQMDEQIWGARPETRTVADYGRYTAWWADSGRPVEPEEWASAQAVQKGESVLGQVLRIERFDGTFGYVHNSAVPFCDESGRVVGSVVAVQDITELQETKDALRQLNAELEQRIAERTAELTRATQTVSAERQRLFEVLETMPTAICLLRDDHTFAFANRPFREQFDSPDGKRCHELCFGQAEPCEFCESFLPLKTGRPHQWEIALPGDRLFEVHDFPFTDADGTRMILEMDFDITEQRQAEAKVKAAHDQLGQRAAQLQALASELTLAEQRERKRLAKILHDHIQQLMVAARLQVELLTRDTNPKRLLATAQVVDSILEEALEASHSLAVELSPPALHTTGLIGGLDWLVSRMQEQHQFTVRMQADTKAEPPSEETRFLLFECIREVLLNAVKHAGVREADIALMRPGSGEIRVVVRDLGKGFDPDVVKKRRPNEVSFGLFSIHERLAYLGGSMDIESAPGRGTQVTLTVPVAEDERAAVTPAEATDSDPDPTVRLRRKAETCRVLIVDDHQIMREGLLRLFEFESDIEVVGQAADGPEAIALASRLAPDVVLMDINLGETDGVEATRRILAAAPEIKVIGLSMHLDKGVASAMREAGAVAFLTKGGSSEALVEAIRTCHRG